jgi:hypothetical protein
LRQARRWESLADAALERRHRFDNFVGIEQIVRHGDSGNDSEFNAAV